MLGLVSEARMSQSDKWAITRGSRELLLSANVPLLRETARGEEACLASFVGKESWNRQRVRRVRLGINVQEGEIARVLQRKEPIG